MTFIVYLLLISNVLCMDMHVDRCPICWENFDKRCMSLTLRRPIVLHNSHAVEKHEFCESCLITLMDKKPIQCPTCRYELQIQDEKKLPKKWLTYKSNY